MIGRSLGHYAIESRLGAGGMGEVYRARDTQLGRSVAIKVLPDAFKDDPERIERFEREAKLLALLNHPHIAALYGFEAFEDQRFLVMELVEGETLAERISRAPIALDEALKIAHQIAEALEAAHEKGIVHRDLKPGNVKVTAEGKVKVLDFGLAKAMEKAPADFTLTNSPTLSMSGTHAGIILGTAAYMSPEQAKGFAADARSDIFSFGCVLYEMQTGRQPFQGDTLAEVMAGVIARTVDFALLPVNLNPRIFELLRRCMEKDPRRRWQAVADVRAEIEVILADPLGLVIQTQPAARRPLWKRAIPAIAGILAGGAIAGIAVWVLKPPLAKEVTRFVFPVNGFSFVGRQILNISPDGTQFVYVSSSVLQLRPTGELDSRTIQGVTADTRNPVFSPDGKSIAFWTLTDQTLKRIPASGGTPVTLCGADNPYGMNWGMDDQIVYGQGSKGIFRVSANSGKPDLLVAPQNGEILHGPQILPGGKAVLFTSGTGGSWDQAKIFIQPLPSGDRKLLIDGGTDARYLPTGHIVYYLAGNLLAVPFDLKNLAVTGRAVPVVEGVQLASGGQTGSAQWSISETGTLIYVPAPAGAATATTTVSIVEASAGGTPLALPEKVYVSARFSPDGKQLAVGTDDGKDADIWVYDLSGKTSLRRLTFNGRNLHPIWSGDSKRILFQSDREKDAAIFWQLADGTAMAERLTKPESGTSHIPESWLPREQKFSYRLTKGDADIWVHSIEDKDGKMDMPLVVMAGSNQHDSIFSPDGRWIAYHSNEARKNGIYVEPYPRTGAKYLIGPGADFSPTWSPDSKDVMFHRRAGGQLHSIRIQTQPTFMSSNPVDVSVNSFKWSVTYRMYDVNPVDGKHFALIRDASQGTTNSTASATVIPEIHVVLNWFEELNRLVK